MSNTSRKKNTENNETVSQSRDWVITQKLSDTVTFPMMRDFMIRYFDASCGQEEEGGKTGYRHGQGFGQSENTRKFQTVKNAFAKAGMGDVHLEARRGSVADCIKYVTKEETRVGGTFTNGTFDMRDKQGFRADLEHLRQRIELEGATYDDLILDSENSHLVARVRGYVQDVIAASNRKKNSILRDDLQVWYIWGESGVGKTSGVLSMFKDKIRDVCRIVSYGNGWADSYESQFALCLDEFDGTIDFGLLLSMADIYPFQLPARYHNKTVAYHQLFIVSNEPLEHWYEGIQEAEPARWKALLRRIPENHRLKVTATDTVAKLIMKAKAPSDESSPEGIFDLDDFTDLHDTLNDKAGESVESDDNGGDATQMFKTILPKDGEVDGD